jgi:hypothetical protein
LAAVVVGLTGTVTWLQLSSTDLAAWIAAVGTIGTLIGTIWLATAETRLRTDIELTKAKMIAASQVLRLNTCIRHFEEISNSINEIDTPNGVEIHVPAHLDSCLAKLQEIDLWSVADCVELIPLPEYSAWRLAIATDFANDAKRRLQIASQQSDPQARDQYAREASLRLYRAIKHLEVANKHFHQGYADIGLYNI